MWIYLVYLLNWIVREDKVKEGYDDETEKNKNLIDS